MSEETIKYQSMAQLARDLGISRTTIYKRATEYEIDYAKLEFTQDELRLLGTRPDPRRDQKRTPKQKHDDEIADLRRAHNTMLQQLKTQHAIELEKNNNNYQASLDRITKTFEASIRQMRTEYDRDAKQSNRRVREAAAQDLERLKTEHKQQAAANAAELKRLMVENKSLKANAADVAKSIDQLQHQNLELQQSIVRLSKIVIPPAKNRQKLSPVSRRIRKPKTTH